MITISDNIYHITDGKYSYAFFVKDGKLVHSYYGKALPVDKARMKSSALNALSVHSFGYDWMPFEVGERGRGDFRIPSAAVSGNGFTSTDFLFESAEVLDDKPSLNMPSLRGKAQTLAVTLKDAVAGLELKLYYTVYDGALARHTEIKNIGKLPVTLCTLDSACTELDIGDYDYISLDGRWGAECGVSRQSVAYGVHTLSSSRGVTSHQHNPFLAVLDKDATEHSGDVYGFNLIYSGNFAARMERDEKSRVRVNFGAQIAEGGISLEVGESFVSPELVSVYTDEGVGGMSRIFHKLYRTRLIDPRFADKPRPIVVNSWESVYFDFDEQKLKRFIDGANGLGIDTVVLDDGWFGKRDSDNCSLGDWIIDRRKLPNGLKAVIDHCKKNGMKFGIWFEPEAISPNSDLYRAHPGWAISTVGRKGIEMRNQYVLDFSNPQVVDYVFEAMRKILAEHEILYVKWDMNRGLSDVPNGKLYFGYVRGVYELYDRLSHEFPNVLIEGCSSGGGRFDPAILYYSPMIWASDDTDAHERTKIQYGLSLCYPLQTLSNHVSVCPNHQSARTTPFDTRGAVASLGCLGYELNVAEISEDEREKIKKQIETYKADRNLILTGELYRLRNPFASDIFCEQVAAEDGSEAYVVAVNTLNKVNLPIGKIKLKGLDENALYSVKELNAQLSGAELMYDGLQPEFRNDFSANIWHIKKLTNKR
ncbi:MAG: alpha-galactosidase [Clostridiales bacterium]|nr:alpha-galactosidase [Clostridiales bacterium]